MGAELVDEPDAPRTVAEGDERLRQQRHPHRRAVGLGQFVGG